MSFDIGNIIETGMSCHFDFTKRYYLSGPMAGYPEHNIPAFKEASEDLRGAGINLLPAHEIKHPEPTVLPCNTCDGRIRETSGLICGTCGWDYSNGEKERVVGGLTWADYLKGDLIAMLSLTQGIILIRGWPQSKGAAMELDIALKLGWPVYYYHDFLLVCMNKENYNGVAQLTST